MTDWRSQPIGMDADGNAISRCPPIRPSRRPWRKSTEDVRWCRCALYPTERWYELPAPDNFALPELPLALKRTIQTGDGLFAKLVAALRGGQR